jgi:hypothetical protein
MGRGLDWNKGMTLPRKGNQIEIDGDIAIVYLTQGQKTLVDIYDLPKVRPYTWYARFVNGSWCVYAYIDPKNMSQELHRWIMDASKGTIVDHHNNDPLDNRRENLRFCTVTQNNWNMRRNSNNTSGYKGVQKEGNRWIARIVIGKKDIQRTFLTIEEAIDQRRKWVLEYHGEFANLG